MRNSTLDIARGIAIINVIGWHVLNFHSIYSDGWTLPIFFIIIGIFYQQSLTLKDIAIKKTNQLLIPHFIFSIPAIIFAIISYKSYSLKTIINPYLCINGSSWFLICTFICYILFHLINLSKNKTYIILWGIIISLSGYYMNYIQIYGHRLILPFFISTAMFSIGFITIGYAFRNIFLNPNKYFIFYIISILANTILIHIWGCNGLEMVWNNYSQNYFIIITNAFLGSLTIIFISNFISKIKFINTIIADIGKKSLIILLLHGYLQHILTFNNSYISFILIIVSSYLLSRYIYKYMPSICGKKTVFKITNSHITIS